MANKKLNRARVQIIRKNTAYWNSTPNILRAGELGYDTDRKIFKIGDGTSKWNELRISFAPFKEMGYTILDGGSIDEPGPDKISVSVVMMNEDSPRYRDGEYIPMKGEPISIKLDDNQYMKIGDGKQTIAELPYVSPPDDATVVTVYGECEDFKV